MKKVRIKLEENGKKISEKAKQIKGITLVALVVTIVVLIILATISINAVLRRKWINQKGTASKRTI